MVCRGVSGSSAAKFSTGKPIRVSPAFQRGVARKNQNTDHRSLDEAKEYVNYLEKESVKKQEQTNQSDTAYQSRRKTMLLNALVVH